MNLKTQFLVIFVLGVVLIAGWPLRYANSAWNYRAGLVAALGVLTTESALPVHVPFAQQQKVTRVILRFCSIYLFALVFLYFQNEVDARQLFKHIDDSLGRPVPHTMHTYDDNCEFEWINIFDNMDHYFMIHLTNWFAASLVVRNRAVLHVWSVLDELIELSVQHILPHFRECWWDHVILDVLMTNTVAIEVGLFLIKVTGMKYYDWLGTSGKKSITQWKLFTDHRYFGSMIFIFSIATVNFMCGFFLINSLWVPPKCVFNGYRLIVWFLMAHLGFGELYNEIDTWGKPERLVQPVGFKSIWLILFVMVLESLCSIKFLKDAGNIIENFETPVYVWAPWLAATVLSVAFYAYLRAKRDPKSRKYPKLYYDLEKTIKDKKVRKFTAYQRLTDGNVTPQDKQKRQ